MAQSDISKLFQDLLSDTNTKNSRAIANNLSSAEQSMQNMSESASNFNNSLNEANETINSLDIESSINQPFQEGSNSASNFTQALAQSADSLTVSQKKFSGFGNTLNEIFSKKTNSNSKGLFSSLSEGMSNVIGKQGKLQKGLGKGAKSIKGLHSITRGFAKKGIGLLSKRLAALAGGPAGAVALAIYEIGNVMVSTFTQGVKYGYRFTKFMIDLPLKIASAAAEIGNSLRNDLVITIGTAVESAKELFDISTKFGSGAGKAIKEFSDSSSSSLLEFRDITSDSVKLFGEGAQGIANRIQALSTRLGEMGPFADIFGKSLSKIINGSADQFNFFEKSIRSLGASSEDVAYIAQEAAKRGVHINTVLLETQQSLSAVALETGVNRKIISKNFLMLQRDIVNFGHLSVRELQETSANLTKLGLTAQDAIGMFSKLDTFESAAQTSAMLSQSFGMNVDALKLIKAEKPDEIFEMLRDSMMITGRSFEQLSRHEKSLLASTTGLSANALKSLMDFRDAGMTYEDAMQKMRENSPEEKQLKAFEDMSGSLKEIKNIMQNTSFITAFMKGISSSFVLMSGLQDKFELVSLSMEKLFLKGLELGKNESLMKTMRSAFKPIEDTLISLVGDGKNKKGLFDGKIIENSVVPFVKTLGAYLGEAFQKDSNLTNLRKSFSSRIKDMFNPNTFLNSPNNPASALFKTGGKLVGQIIKGFAVIGPGLINTFASAFRGLTDFLTGYGGADNSIKRMILDTLQISNDEFNQIYSSYENMISIIKTKIVPPLFEFFNFVNSKVAGFVINIGFELGKQVGFAFIDGFKAAVSGMLESTYDYTIGILTNESGLGITKSANLKERLAYEKRATETGMTSEILNKQFYKQITQGSDIQQDRKLGQLISILEREKMSSSRDKQIEIENIIKSLRNDSTLFDGGAFTGGLGGITKEINKSFKLLNKENMIASQRELKEDMEGLSGTFSYLGSELSTNFPNYGVFDLVKDVGQILTSSPRRLNNSNVNINQTQNERPVEVSLILDGDIIASKLINPLVRNDLFGKGRDRSIARGATSLSDISTINQSGGSNESSSF